MSLFDRVKLGLFRDACKRVLVDAVENILVKNEKHQQSNDDIDCFATEYKRKSAVNQKRKDMPCFFCDGITREEFASIAKEVANGINRISKVSVKGAVIWCTVESQTGYSDWDFNVDFNNWGHIDGTYWSWSENDQSNIPKHYGTMVSSCISRLLNDRNIIVEDFSNSVDMNKMLETASGLQFKSKAVFPKNLFTNKHLMIKHDAEDLIGEHLYPVLSLLQSYGFRKINSIPLYDVDGNSDNYDYEVDEIMIDGKNIFDYGDVFPAKSQVYIVYHYKKNILMPYSQRHFKNRNYIEVGDELQEMGYTQIYERPIKDLITGLLKRNGSVERVLVEVDREQPIVRNASYLYDAKIIICYHTYQK